MHCKYSYMHFCKKICLLVIVFFVFHAAAFTQFDTSVISAALKQKTAQLGSKYAFMLYKDGKVVYKKEDGEFTIKTQQYVEGASQWLTAALVLVMVQEGKVSLDDKISTYLPIYAKYGKAYITLRHCLTHNTGIDGAKAMQKSNFKTLEEEVDYYAVNREIKTNPGTEFYYSNIGFKLAARVLEVVSKKPFERLMKEKLTGPLAMRATTFSNDDYDRAPDPANGARSTASDYLNFVAMLLNKGAFNGKQVLTEASVNTLLSLQARSQDIKNPPKNAAGLDYSLGSWILEKNTKGEPVVLTALGSDDSHPLVDLCHGYAFVIFSYTTEVKKETWQQIKAAIDETIKIDCGQ